MRVRALVLVLASLVLAACGGGGGDAPGHEGHTDETKTETGAGRRSFGSPGQARAATRTVEVRMLDSLKFDPPSIQVKAGETVKFKLVNQGQLVHEFFLGDEATQVEHEKERQQAGAGHHMHEANGVDLQGGKQAELTWTFAGPGTLSYVCHEPGHKAGGMVGTIRVT